MVIYTIIVTYNAMQWIDRCLTALSHSTVPTTAIVIDNCSTDGTREYLPQNYPDAVWMPQDRNLGFGQGNNVGIRYALEHNADYVLLLNQDAYLQPDALQLMLAQSDGRSLLSPVHLNGDGTRLDRMFRYLINEADPCIVDDVLVGRQLKDVYRVGRISAACWLLPVATVREIGGFNKLFFHYSEDDNYLNRLQYHGIATHLIPAARVWHDRGEHGNVKVFNAKRLHRDILLIACNINLSCAQRAKLYLRRLYECYAWDLPQKAYRPLAWIKEMMWIVVNSKQINQSRAKEMEKGASWL